LLASVDLDIPHSLSYDQLTFSFTDPFHAIKAAIPIT
jgi:hypothetical protein